MTETVDTNSGTSAEGVLHLAQKIYEEHVAAGEAIRAQAIAESEEEARRILSNAETTAARLLDEAEKVHSEKTAAAKIEAENLVRESTQQLEETKNQIALLQAFEAEYRKELRGLVDMASAILNPVPLAVDDDEVEEVFESVDEDAPSEESDEDSVDSVEEETSEESDVEDDVLDVDEDTEAEEAPVDEPVVEVEDTVNTEEKAEVPETELSEADGAK